MRDQSKWLFLLATMVRAWQESGENPAVFCYLMIWGATSILCERAS